MAVTNLTEITQIFSINGTELVYLIQYDSLTQTWVDYVATSETISSFSSGIQPGSISMRQLKAAMAQQSVLVETDENVPSDITNSYNIAWLSAYRMSPGDPFVTGFLVPLLGQTEVNTLFALGPSFPV